MMPLNLILVRHGQSIANWINDLIRADHYNQVPTRFYGVPIWRLCLTELGQTQADLASNWLDQYFGLAAISAAFHSPYVRAIETASHIRLIGRIWRENAVIRERSWGDMDHVPTPEEYERYRFAKVNKSPDLCWQPPNGEEMMALSDRLSTFYGTLHRQHAYDNAICVMHGESIVAIKMDLERIHRVEANQMIERKDPILSIPNCGITQYTRVNPSDHNKIHNHLTWVREIDPTNPPSDPDSLWREIKRPKLSSVQLGELVSNYGIK